MLTVRDIMTADVVAIGAETDLRRTAEILVRHHVSGAPVVADGRVVGVVSVTDLLEFMQASPTTPAEPGATVEWEEGVEPPGAYYVEWWTDARAEVGARFRALQAEWDRLRQHTVADVMSRSLCAVRPDATVTSAADYLLRAGVHRVLVLDTRRLVGILTTTDFVRAVAQERLGEVSAPGRVRSLAAAGG
jgi:CBS domain-containing protein